MPHDGPRIAGTGRLAGGEDLPGQPGQGQGNQPKRRLRPPPARASQTQQGDQAQEPVGPGYRPGRGEHKLPTIARGTDQRFHHRRIAELEQGQAKKSAQARHEQPQRHGVGSCNDGQWSGLGLHWGRGAAPRAPRAGTFAATFAAIPLSGIGLAMLRQRRRLRLRQRSGIGASRLIRPAALRSLASLLSLSRASLLSLALIPGAA